MGRIKTENDKPERINENKDDTPIDENEQDQEKAGNTK